MVFPSLQISFSSSGTNGVIFTNSRLISSPAHGVSVSQKPIFCMFLGPPWIRRTRIFHLKKPKFGVLNALPDGGIEAHSTSSRLLEKEFKFSPTFDEYVKVLESVRTDRSRFSSEEGDVHVLKKKSVRRDASKTGSVREKKKLSISKEQLSKEKFGAEEKVRDTKYARGNASYQRHAGAEKSSSAWTMVEGILEKKAKEKRDPQQSGGLEHRKSDGYLDSGRNVVHKKIKGAGKVDDDMTLEKKRMSQRKKHGEPRENRKGFKRLDDLDSSKFARGEMGHRAYGNSNHSISFGHGGSYEGNKFSKGEWPNSAKIVGKTESSSRWDKMNKQDYYRRSKMKNLEFERNQNYHEGVLYPSTKEISDKDSSRSNVTLHGGSIEAEKPNSRGLVTLRRSGRTAVAYTNVSEGDIDGLDLEDRAAFRTFEKFTDVRNRPRVLRMELEERIQGLAKWLNASNLNMPEWQFSKMIHSAKIKFSEHSILRIVQVLGSFGNWRQVLQVIEWFHSRERFKYYKSKYIYTTALDVLGKAKRPVEALNIFYAMRQELSSYPDRATYHCIAVTLGQAGLMKELFDVIECMRAAPGKKFDLGPLQKWDPRLEPDLVVYNAVLNACVQQKQWEGAFWVLQELKKQGIRPSSTTYGLIMEVMLACGKYNLVHEFFRKSQKNSIPGALNYKVLINTLWKEGKVEEAVQAVKDMERRGIVGSASLYYDLARCLCSAGRCLEALQQVNKISKVAKRPLVVTYTGLIQACLDTENIENASYIFSQMKNFCSPNVITCNIMLKSYVKHEMFEEAIDLFQNILAGSHEINSKAELRQKVLPDKFTFNTMIEACAAASKWDAFENSYREMLHHGYHFDEKRHMCLVFDAWRAGKKHILEVTWNHLVSNGRIPPPAIIKELFCMKMEDDEPATAISFITTHDMEIDAFSQKSWLNLLQRKAHSIRGKTIHRLSNELRSIISESARSHPVYQNLLKACKEFASSFDVPILLYNSDQKS